MFAEELNNAEEQNPAWIYPITPKFYMSTIATEEEASPDIIVTQEDFKESLLELPSSVSPAEIAHYLDIKRRFEGERIGPYQESRENGDANQHHEIGEFRLELSEG